MKSKTESEIDQSEYKRWYLGDGVSRIIDGDTSYLVVKVEFPESKFAEWDKSCKEEFLNCRSAKMINDHTKAKMFDLMVENKFSIKQEKKEEPKKEFCLGGEEIGG